MVRNRWKNPNTRDRENKKAWRTEHEKFATWWRGVCDDGVLLKRPGLKRGEDYLGDLPWPDAVSLRSLYNEYVSDANSSCSINVFMNMARLYCGYTPHSKRSFRLAYDDGTTRINMGEKHVAFYSFPRSTLTEVSRVW